MCSRKAENPSPTPVEWARSLKWHPDLAHDLRACRSMILTERRTKRIWLQAPRKWAYLSVAFFPDRPLQPLPNSDYFPVTLAAGWIHKRYQRLWDTAPILPVLTIQNVLEAAVEVGAWSPVITIIERDLERDKHERKVNVDVFANVKDVHTPEWVAIAESQPSTQWLLRLAGETTDDLPAHPAILLTLDPNATRQMARDALDAIWPDVDKLMNRPVGARPEKEAQGRAPNYAQHVTLYRLYRQWQQRRAAGGAPPSKMAFARAISQQDLPIQQRIERIFANHPRDHPTRIAWLSNQGAGYLVKKLTDEVLPILEPDKQVKPLSAYTRV